MRQGQPGGAARQAAVYVVSNVLSRVLSLALVPVLTHFLTQSEYGFWGVATAWSNLTTLMLLFGLYTPVTRLYFDEPNPSRRRQVYGTLFLFQCVGGAVLVTTVVAALQSAHSSQAANTQTALWIGYFTSLNLIPLSLMRAREQAERHAVVSVSASVATALGPFVALLIGPRTASSALKGLFYANAGVTLVYGWLLRDDISWEFSLSRLIGVLRHSLQFVPHSFASWVLNLSDRVLIQAFLGQAIAGVYIAGYTLASGLSLIIEGIGNSWLTFFLKAERNPEQRVQVTVAATHFVAISAWCALAAALFLPVFVRLALPPGYAMAEPIAIIVVLALMLTAPYLVWVYAVMSVKRTTAFPLVTVAAAASNVILNVWLVPRIGVLAAAVNTMAGYAVQAGLTALVAWRVYPIRYEYGRWALALVGAAAVGGLCLVAPHWSIHIELIWRGIMLILVPGLFVAGGFLQPEEASRIRAFLIDRRGMFLRGTGR